MRNARLLSTVAATLLLTIGAASAQDMKKDEAPAPAPAAQQNMPAEKIAPSMKAGEPKAVTHKASETLGQAPKASDADKTRATDKGSMDKGAMDKGAAGKSSLDANGSADSKSKSKDSAAEGAASSKSSQSTTEQNRATTGQGAAAGSLKLSTEQRTKITSIIKQKKVEPTHLTVSVRVGTRLPESVHYYPLPVEVVEVYPEWRGYNYILVGDQIVIIDPRTHEIVAILEA
jgi:hypothetical protein